MNKMVLLGSMLVILSLGCVGGSFITATHTETYKENVPVEEEVTKTKEVPVETQVPKTREVEKQKTVTQTEKVPVWSGKSQQVKFITQDRGSTLYITDIKVKLEGPMKIVVRNPVQSEINKKRYQLNVDFGSYEYAGMRYYYAIYTYRNYPGDCWGCYYDTTKQREEGKWECLGEYEGEKDYKYNYKDNEFILDPMHVDWPAGAVTSKGETTLSFFMEVYEYTSSDWERIYMTGTQYSMIPYLDIYYMDHYETKPVSKTITYKETETYYITETIMKQETYTEKVTVQKEETKTREVEEKPYAMLLWLGIMLFILGAALVAFGSRKKEGVKEITPSGTFCPKCGKENLADDVFCANCGTKLK